jgi:hypothetical protein|tara:strand:- start:491 stop:715 length:225 start_codon:yes stop_codon:yes gene_type:complete
VASSTVDSVIAWARVTPDRSTPRCSFFHPRRPLAGLTFPQARAIVQEIFTALLFAQKPHYLKRIEALRSVKLQI